MLTHHIAASGVLFAVIFSNSLSFGCTMAFLLDIADITGSIVKWWAQTPYTFPTMVTFFVNMAVWGYTRNYLLPQYVYWVFTVCIYSYTGKYEQF